MDTIASETVEIRISVLLKEYERVCTDIRTIESQNEKIVGFGLTLIGAGVAYGLAQKLPEMFVILPFIFIAILFYAVLQYHNVFWHGGYKKAIEDRINALLGAPTLSWERVVDHRRRVHAANLPLVTIYFFLLIGTGAFSTSKVFSEYGPIVGYAQGAATCLFLVALLFAVRRTFRGFEESYKVATKILSEIDDQNCGGNTSQPNDVA